MLDERKDGNSKIRLEFYNSYRCPPWHLRHKQWGAGDLVFQLEAATGKQVVSRQVQACHTHCPVALPFDRQSLYCPSLVSRVNNSWIQLTPFQTFLRTVRERQQQRGQ